MRNIVLNEEGPNTLKRENQSNLFKFKCSTDSEQWEQEHREFSHSIDWRSKLGKTGNNP
jgi:hypothetical protein